MKIRIEIDKDAMENEIVIKCREENATTKRMEQLIMEALEKSSFIFYKEKTEYYLSLDSILFFETSNNCVDAHTLDNVYQVKNKLYQLEELLPRNFIRVSKSTILNVKQIYSIEKSITSFSTVSFKKTHKKVYVSRNYYKNLKQRLSERNDYYEN